MKLDNFTFINFLFTPPTISSTFQFELKTTNVIFFPCQLLWAVWSFHDGLSFCIFFTFICWLAFFVNDCFKELGRAIEYKHMCSLSLCYKGMLSFNTLQHPISPTSDSFLTCIVKCFYTVNKLQRTSLNHILEGWKSMQILIHCFFPTGCL